MNWKLNNEIVDIDTYEELLIAKKELIKDTYSSLCQIYEKNKYLIEKYENFSPSKYFYRV